MRTKSTPPSEEVVALEKFFEAPFSEVGRYWLYVNGTAPFDTHQGVGLEFDRVLVIMDDSEARASFFGYEKLLGAKAPTEADIRNTREGKETSLDRTRRLFYVTCSRARKSLALIMYSANPQAVKAFALKSEWFKSDEIILQV